MGDRRHPDRVADLGAVVDPGDVRIPDARSGFRGNGHAAFCAVLLSFSVAAGCGERHAGAADHGTDGATERRSGAADRIAGFAVGAAVLSNDGNVGASAGVCVVYHPAPNVARPRERAGGGAGSGVDRERWRLEHVRRNVCPMTMYKPPRRPQFFYTTAPLPCPYLAGRTERKVVTEIAGPDAEALHDRLSRAGFRRSHNIAYAPVCPSCQACVPIRIPVATFQPDRTLRRVAKANALLEGFEVPARATPEQFQLFQRYQQARHGDGDMATMSFYDYRAMVEDTPIETM